MIGRERCCLIAGFLDLVECGWYDYYRDPSIWPNVDEYSREPSIFGERTYTKFQNTDFKDKKSVLTLIGYWRKNMMVAYEANLPLVHTAGLKEFSESSKNDIKSESSKNDIKKVGNDDQFSPEPPPYSE